MNLGLRIVRSGIAALALSGMGVGTAQIVLASSAFAAYGTVTATTAVNVRAGTSTSTAIVGVLYYGQTAKQVGAVANGWVPISYNGTTRYVSAAYVTGEMSDDPDGSATTTAPTRTPTTVATVAEPTTVRMWATDDVHVRTGPSLSDSIVGILAKGNSVTATGRTSGAWTQVNFGGQVRWIYSAYLTTGAPTTASLPKVVGFARTTTALMIRTTSGSDFTSLGDLPTGSVVALTGVTAPGVAQIIYNSTLRWVNSLYLVPIGTTYTATGSPSAKAKAAVAFAMAQVGKKYVWGGTGPDAYDCSGLVLKAWASAGVSLPRTSQQQFTVGTSVAIANLQPGDVVFYYSGISHDGIYIGNGQIVHAANPSDGVTIDRVDSMPIAGARRFG